MPTYVLNIVVQGRDQGATSTVRGLHGALSGLQSVGMGILSVFGGNVLASIFNSITSSIAGMAREAIIATSDFQALQVGLQGLVAREMAEQFNRANVRTEVTSIIVGLTAKEMETLEKLTDKYEDSGFRLAVLRERYDEWVASGTRGEAELANLAHSISELETDMAGYASTIADLNAKQNEATTITRTVAGATMSAGEMYEAAAEPARRLLDWIRQIAVTTPFTVEQLADTLRMSLAYGFMGDEAKRLTLAIGNFASGMGLTDLHMRRIIENFGQMAFQGKVTGMELRDLARGAFVPVNELLTMMAEKHGVTTAAMKEMATTGKVDVNEFFQAFMEMAERDFPNAMDRMARTWRTAVANVHDFIQSVIGAQLLGPLFDQLAGMVADSLRAMVQPESREFFQSLGETMGVLFEHLLPFIGEFSVAVRRLMGVLLEMIGIDISSFGIHGMFFEAFLAARNLLQVGADLANWLSEALPRALAAARETLDPIIDALGELVAAFLGSGPALEEWGGFFLETLTRVVGEEGPVIIENIASIIRSIATLWEQHGATIIEGISLTLSAALNVLMIALSLVTGLIAALLTLLTGDVTGAIGQFTETLSGFFASVLEMAGTTTEGFVESWRGTFELLGIIVNEIGERIAFSVGAFLALLYVTVVSGANLIVSFWRGAWQSAHAALQETVGGITLSVRGLLSSIRAVIMGFYVTLRALGVGIIDSLRQGVEDAIGGLVTAVVNGILGVIAAAREALESGSPSQVFMRLGQGAMQGFASGVQQASSPTVSAVNRSLESLVGALSVPQAVPITVDIHDFQVRDDRDIDKLAERVVAALDRRYR